MSCSVKNICIICKTDESTITICSGCKSQVSYCSKECQIYDWKNHKQQCILLKTISNIEQNPSKLINIMDSNLVKKVTNYVVHSS